jgi:hypothetical protein
MKNRKHSTLSRVIMLTLVLVSFHFYSNAQFAFSLGPKAGVAITSFHANNATVSARANGFWGLFTNFQLGRGFAIQPEFLMTRRGADVTSNNSTTRFKLNYFEVPILAKFRLPLANETVFPHLLVGPNFGFKTKFNVSGTDTGNGTTVMANTSDIKKNDVGGLVGAGIDFQTRTSGIMFTIDGRYGFGFSNAYSNNNTTAVTLRNIGWMFSAGLGFRIGNSSRDLDD